MDHPAELELIEWVAGRLTPERAAAIETHLAACDPCRHKASAQRQTWDAMGDWTVTPRAHHLWSCVEARLRDTSGHVRRERTGWPWMVVRAAAAILLAAAVGHVAGRWVRSRTVGPPSTTTFAEALHLDALGAESPVGLTAAMRPLMPGLLKEDIR